MFDRMESEEQTRAKGCRRTGTDGIRQHQMSEVTFEAGTNQRLRPDSIRSGSHPTDFANSDNPDKMYLMCHGRWEYAAEMLAVLFQPQHLDSL